MSRCKACDRIIDTYDRVTTLNTQILESVYNIDPYTTTGNLESLYEVTLEDTPKPLYPTFNELEARPEEDLCVCCRNSLIESAQHIKDYQFYDLE